jgi:hypothetical protein
VQNLDIHKANPHTEYCLLQLHMLRASSQYRVRLSTANWGLQLFTQALQIIASMILWTMSRLLSSATLYIHSLLVQSLQPTLYLLSYW